MSGAKSPQLQPGDQPGEFKVRYSMATVEFFVALGFMRFTGMDIGREKKVWCH